MSTTPNQPTLTIDNREMVELAARDIARRASRLAALCSQDDDADHERIAEEAYEVRELAERMDEIATRGLP